MKRLIPILFLILLLPATSYAQDLMARMSPAILGGGVAAAPAADYVLYDGRLYCAEAAGSKFKILLFSSDGTLIATSAEGTCPGSADWVTVTFTSGPTLTATSTYYLGFISNGYVSIRHDATGYDQSAVADTYASPPYANVVPATDEEVDLGEISIYVRNSTAQTLLGNSEQEATSASAAGNNIFYFENGYTCNTL